MQLKLSVNKKEVNNLYNRGIDYRNNLTEDIVINIAGMNSFNLIDFLICIGD